MCPASNVRTGASLLDGQSEGKRQPKLRRNAIETRLRMGVQRREPIRYDAADVLHAIDTAGQAQPG